MEEDADMIPSDAAAGDVFTDATGKLWRVQSIQHEPTVTMDEVEGTLHDPNAPVSYLPNIIPMQLSGLAVPRASIVKRSMSGAIGAAMWNDFMRIWRRG